MGSEVIEVSSLDELYAALGSASGGETIVLAGENYGDFRVDGAKIDSGGAYDLPVTLTSMDSENPAVFNTIKLVNLSNVVLDGIDVTLEVDDTTVRHQSVLEVAGSDNVVVRNSSISTTVDLGAEGVEPGSAMGYLMVVKSSNDIVIENNEIVDGARGIVLDETEGLTIVDNLISDTRQSSIAGGNVSDVLVDNNVLTNLYTAPGDHAGFIRLWVDEPGYTSSNLTFTNNHLLQGAGWGAYSFLEDNFGGGYKDVVFADNVVHSSHHHGFWVENVDGLVLSSNTLLQADLEDNYGNSLGNAPTLLIHSSNINVVASDNIGDVIVNVDDPVARNILVENNVSVQSTDPDGENYVGDHFVNALAWPAQPEDLQLLPDSMLSEAGVGARQSEYGWGVDYKGVIYDEAGEGANVSTLQLRLDDLFFDGGDVDLDGASVVWDFGDGATAEGQAVEHQFESAGYHSVLATIVADIATFVVEKTVYVETPVALAADFDDGVYDQSDIENAVSTHGEVSLVEVAGGNAIRLETGGSYVQFRSSAELTKNENFTISLKFKIDPGTLEQTADLIYFPGTALITVDGGALSVATRTDESEIVGYYAADVLTEDEWAELVYAYSADDGVAQLFLNGEMIGEMTGFEGGPSSGGWTHFRIGDPFGANFEGLIDDVQMLRHFATPDEIAESAARAAAAQDASTQDGENLGETFDAEEPADSAEPAAPIDDGDEGAGHGASDQPAEPQDEEILEEEPLGLAVDERLDVDQPVQGWEVVSSIDSQMIEIEPIEAGHYTDLGPLWEIADESQLWVALDFQHDAVDGDGWSRILWKHMKYGVEVKDDEVRVRVGVEEGGMATIAHAQIDTADTDWHQLVLSVDDEAGKVALYVDSQLIVNEEVEGLAATGGNNHKVTVGGTVWGHAYDGNIDNIAVGIGAIDSADIASLETNAASDSQMSTIGFDRDGRVTFDHVELDELGDAGRVALVGDAEVIAHGDDAQDVYVSLDGRGDYVNLGRFKGQETVDLSFDFRLSDMSEKDHGVLIENHRLYRVDVDGDSLLLRVAQEDGSLAYYRVDDLNISEGAWHNLALNLSELDGSIQMYLDDARVLDETNGALAVAADSTADVTFGGRHWGDQLLGDVDNFVYEFA